jgi:hypothetical protein
MNIFTAIANFFRRFFGHTPPAPPSPPVPAPSPTGTPPTIGPRGPIE